FEIHGTNLWTDSIGRCENKRSVYVPVGSTGNKKQQEAAARKEIAKKRQVGDESELKSSSGSESKEGGEEASDGDDPLADDTEEGNDDVEESGDDDTKAEESGNKESVAEKSGEQVEDSDPATTPEASSKRWFVQGSQDVYYAGLSLNDKGNPTRSIQEDPKIQINVLNEV
ncbi:hypothetical protein HAX54_029414, partial [Datura stramonium]|nr:hypothetical protein [Datura stramonium]